jgi:hypothetical protein
MNRAVREGTKETHENVRVHDVPAEIRTKHVMNPGSLPDEPTTPLTNSSSVSPGIQSCSHVLACHLKGSSIAGGKLL